jgi:hypothetical protein
MARKGKRAAAKRRRKFNAQMERERAEQRGVAPVRVRFVDPAELRRQTGSQRG